MAKAAPLVGRVVAGFPSPAEQYAEQPLSIDDLLIKRPTATFFVWAEGDSMIGEGIHDGDLLVVDRSIRPADGDVIIAAVDGEFTVKTYRSARGRTWLQAANPAYPDIVLDPRHELDYFGKVIAFVHPYIKV